MRLLLLAALLAASEGALALKVIVGHPPGGSQDVIVRSIAKASGKTLTPEYRPGAGGHRALAHAARHKPDGETIIIGSSSIISGQFFYRDLGYTPQDFVPLAYIGEADNVLLVHPSVPARTVRELIQLARAKDVSFGYGGMSTNSYVGMMRMLRLGGAKMHPIGYKSSTDAPPDLLRGDIDTMLLPTPVAAGAYARAIETGRLRAIATTGRERSTYFPSLPTVGQTFPGFHSVIWWAFFVSKAEPEAARMRATMESAVSVSGAALRGAGVTPASMSAERLASFLRDEDAMWRALDRQHNFPRGEF